MVARQAAQRVRNKLAPAWIEASSARIQREVVQLDEFRDARSVGVYLARPREVATDAIVRACREDGKTLCLPAFQKELDRYGLCRWDEGAVLRAGAYGIAEPAERAWVPTKEIDLMIVTALAFDELGWRLGHGGGHFDRLLAEHPGVKMCLAFECQRMTAVPCEPHDVPVNIVVTEARMYRAPARLAYADPEELKKKYAPGLHRRR